MSTSLIKKLLTIAIIFLTAIPIQAEVMFNTDRQSLRAHLESLNCYWQGQPTTAAFYDEEMQFMDFNCLIQTHLGLVIERLEKTYPSWLPRENRIKRLALLDTLKQYRDRGVFPENSYHSKVTPYFIDRHNVACAVGHLIRQSGNEALAVDISERYNYDYIENMPLPEIEEWAYNYGFDPEELKWIQPGYFPNASANATQVQPSECGQANGIISVELCSNDIFEYEGPLTEDELLDTCLFYSIAPYTFSWENLITGSIYQDSLTIQVPAGVYLFTIQFQPYPGFYLQPISQDFVIVNDDIGTQYSYQQIEEGPGNPLDGKLYIIGEYDSIAWYNMSGELVSTNDTLTGLDGEPSFLFNYFCYFEEEYNISDLPYQYIARIWLGGCNYYKHCYIRQQGIDYNYVTVGSHKMNSSCNNANGRIELQLNYQNNYLNYCELISNYLDVYWSNGETGFVNDSLSPGMYIASYDIALDDQNPVWQNDTFYIEELCYSDCEYNYLLRYINNSFPFQDGFSDLANIPYNIVGVPDDYLFLNSQIYEFDLNADSINTAGDTVYTFQCFRPYECELSDTGIIRYCDPYFLIETTAGDSTFIRDWAELIQIQNNKYIRNAFILFDGLEIVYSIQELEVTNTCGASKEGILLCAEPINCIDALTIEAIFCINPSNADYCTCELEELSQLCTGEFTDYAVFEGSCDSLECQNSFIYFHPTSYVLKSNLYSSNTSPQLSLKINLKAEYIFLPYNSQVYLNYHNGLEQIHQNISSGFNNAINTNISCSFLLWENFQILPQNYEVCLEISNNSDPCNKTFCATVFEEQFFGEDCYTSEAIAYEAYSFQDISICACDGTYYDDINAFNNAPQAILNWEWNNCIGYNSIQANDGNSGNFIYSAINSQVVVPIGSFLDNDFGQNLEIIFIDSTSTDLVTINWQPGSDSLVVQVSDCHYSDFNATLLYVISDGNNTDTAYHTIIIDPNPIMIPAIGNFEANCVQGSIGGYYELFYYPSDYIQQYGDSLYIQDFPYELSIALDGQVSYALGLVGQWHSQIVILTSCNNEFRVSLDDFAFCQTPLPIEVVSFYGSTSEHSNELYWETGLVTEPCEFILAHAVDGLAFNTIHSISNEGHTPNYLYSHKDYAIGNNYYRLSYKLQDGSIKHLGHIIQLNRDSETSAITLYPNPAHDYLYLSITPTQGNYEIYNAMGDKVKELQDHLSSKIDIRSLPPGIYFLKEINSKAQSFYRFVKTH